MAEEGGPIAERRTAYEVQQDFALMIGRPQGVTWDALMDNDEGIRVLQRNIANLMPDVEGRRQNQVERARSELFNAVWSQRKYTNGALHSALIYIVVTQEENFELAKRSTQYTCHPVYRTRKCMRRDSEGNETTNGCCMVFVDENGRVYKDWQYFLDTNVLPKGWMLAPRNGVYNIGDDEVIALDHEMTPAATTTGRRLNTTNRVVGVTAMAALVPVVATLAIPVAAPILAVASAVGLTATAYGSVCSVTDLVDRANHEQSTSLGDPEARNSWLNVAGSAVSLGAAGATNLLVDSWVAGNGLTTANKLLVSGLNYSAVFVSGTGAVTGIYDIILKVRDDEPVTGMDVLQLASSLTLFTHSLNNMLLANQVIETSQRGRTARRTLRRNLRNGIRTYSHLRQGNDRSGDCMRIFDDIPDWTILSSLHLVYTYLRDPSPESGNVIDVREHFNYLQFAMQYCQRLVSRVVNWESFADILRTLAIYFTRDAAEYLKNLVVDFLEAHADNLNRMLNTFISAESALYRFLTYVLSRSLNTAIEILREIHDEMVNTVMDYFLALRPTSANGQRVECEKCGGHFAIYNI